MQLPTLGRGRAVCCVLTQDPGTRPIGLLTPHELPRDLHFPHTTVISTYTPQAHLGLVSTNTARAIRMVKLLDLPDVLIAFIASFLDDDKQR